MERIPVKSSDLKSVGYDVESRTLEVEFVNKSVYQYSHVTRDVYEDLINAKSQGKFFAKFIKNNKCYGCQQVFPKEKFVRL